MSKRATLAEAVVAIGFSKRTDTLTLMLPTMNRLIHRVRKVRLMGAAALSMVYVASGRFDAYTETGVHLWDIAAGGLIIPAICPLPASTKRVFALVSCAIRQAERQGTMWSFSAPIA